MSEESKPALRACADALAPSPPVLRELLNALYPYIDWFGGAHDEECPQDDTCDCETGRVNHRLNAAIRAAESAADALAPPEPPALGARANGRRKQQIPSCECGHYAREHERIWDPEAEPKPRYFWFCRGCKRAGKKYPETHHQPLPAPPRADALEAPRMEIGYSPLAEIVRDLHTLPLPWKDTDVDDRNALTAKWRGLLRAAALDAAPSPLPAVCPPALNDQIEAQIDHDKAMFEAGYVHGQQCAADGGAVSRP